MTRWRLLALAPLLAAGVGWLASGPAVAPRVHDRAGLFDAEARASLDRRLELWHREAGVDAHVLVESGVELGAIEGVAASRFGELGVARGDRSAQGLLVVLDPAGQRLRIEIGYGLEDVFPDAFAGWLIDDHARHLFASEDRALALRLTVRILEHRLRVARLSGRRPHQGPHLAYSSGGAGASGNGAEVAWNESAARPGRNSLALPKLPADAYRAYVRWLAGDGFDPRAPLFTAASREHLARFPLTPALKDHAHAIESDRSPQLLVRGDHAVVFSNDEPLASPLFLSRSGPKGTWQVDLALGFELVAPMAGGRYAWTLRNAPALAPFAGDVVRVDGFLRFRNGDNRPLPDSA